MQKILKADFKPKNGKRQTKDFPFELPEGAVEGSSAYAMAVATVVSNAAAYGSGRDWRIVNWSVK